MKLHAENYGFEANLPDNRTAFKIKTSAKMFNILSSGIYKDKIQAVIRELSCNAYDSHVSAGKKNVPFKIQLPTRLDMIFAVEDLGTGIEPSRIGDIYWTYGESSKTESNDQIGALGLGSKSPFAYAKGSYIVRNRWNGVEYTYMCAIGANGTPDGSLVGEIATDQPNGVRVEMAVRDEDMHAFHERARRFLRYWSGTRPEILGADSEDIFSDDIKKVIEGKDWFLEAPQGYRSSGALAIMGNVPYRIDVDAIPNIADEMKFIARSPFVITFALGDLSFASSREELEYDEFTCESLIKRFGEIRDDIAKVYKKKIYDTKLKTHIDFMRNFVSIASDTNSALKIGTTGDAARFICGDKKANTLKFSGQTFLLDNVLNTCYEFQIPGVAKFGVYGSVSRRTRRRLESLSRIEVKVQSNTTGLVYRDMFTRYDDHPHGALKVTNGYNHEIEWRQSTKRVVDTDIARVKKALSENRIASTTSFLVGFGTLGHNPTFYVNDCGTTGASRFLASTKIYEHDYYVELDRDVSADVVKSELEQLIAGNCTGFAVKMVSALADERIPAEREKITKGNIRVKFYDLVADVNQKPSMSTISEFNYSPYKVKEISRSKIADEIVSIDEMVNDPKTLFVYKRRTDKKYFDTSDGDAQSVLFESGGSLMDAFYTIGLLKGVTKQIQRKAKDGSSITHDVVRVYVLTEGQVKFLREKRVTLCTLKAYLCDSIKELNTKEKFSEIVEPILAIKSTKKLNNLMEMKKSLDGLTINPGLFQKRIAEYEAADTKPANWSDLNLRYSSMSYLIGPAVSAAKAGAQIDVELIARYPLLGLINYNRYDMTKAATDKAARAIVDYVNLIDNQPATALTINVKNAQEFAENCLQSIVNEI